MGEHGAALLGKPRHVDHAATLPLKMRGHAKNGADGDNAGAADAINNCGPSPVQRCSLRFRQADERIRRSLENGTIGFADAGAMHGDEGGAEAFDAGKILVAAGLIDPPLATEFSLGRLDGDAVGLDAAIATALAYQLIDNDPLVWIGVCATLSAAPDTGRDRR